MGEINLKIIEPPGFIWLPGGEVSNLEEIGFKFIAEKQSKIIYKTENEAAQ